MGGRQPGMAPRRCRAAPRRHGRRTHRIAEPRGLPRAAIGHGPSRDRMAFGAISGCALPLVVRFFQRGVPAVPTTPVGDERCVGSWGSSLGAGTVRLRDFETRKRARLRCGWLGSRAPAAFQRGRAWPTSSKRHGAAALHRSGPPGGSTSRVLERYPGTHLWPRARGRR